jgi:hypothetical protein
MLVNCSHQIKAARGDENERRAAEESIMKMGKTLSEEQETEINTETPEDEKSFCWCCRVREK